MWRKSLFRGVLVASLLSSAAAWGTTRALIMSIGEYQSGIPQLSGVKYDAENARTIAHRLGVRDENILQFQDAQLTLTGMRAAFDRFYKVVEPNDEVFIYYSGHGGRQYVRDPVERCAESLVTVDGKGFIDSEFERRLDELSKKARRIIVFLDSCHSGGVTKRTLLPDGAHALFTPKYWSKGKADACTRPVNIITRNLGAKTRSLGSGAQNYVYIAAARDDEVSFDEPGKGGLATQAWVKCISGTAADLDGSGGISADELRACSQKSIDNTIKGAPEIEPSHLSVAGNAHAVLAFKERDSQEIGSVGKVDPYGTLMDIYNSRDDRRVVAVTPKKKALRIGKDKLEFSVSSSDAGYVYILMVGSDGKTFDLLFPNALDSGYYLEAGETLTLPAPNWQITAQGPAGKDHLLVMVADSKRDFSHIGAKAAGPFSVVDADIQVARNIQIVTSGTKQVAKKDCEKKSAGHHRAGTACSNAYGAAILSLDEIE